MKAVLQKGYNGHSPQTEIWAGHTGKYIETPERAYSIRDMLANSFPEIGIVEASAVPDKWIRAVHSGQMVDFLEENHLEAIVKKAERPDIILGSDSALSLSPNTYETARQAVSAALTGAELLLDGEKAVYALCRPPGHHATRTRMGGYCFFNNAAIAALHLVSRGKRVYVLDIDLHHGNGTQDILTGVKNAFFFSINGSRSYPGIISGRESSRINAGNVRNANLSSNASSENYLRAVFMAKSHLSGSGSNYDALVISAGFDTSEEEPPETLGESDRISLPRECFEEIGAEIEEAGIPTLIVQEGGYHPEALGRDVCAFLSAFARKR